jgi:hypothetical protein
MRCHSVLAGIVELSALVRTWDQSTLNTPGPTAAALPSADFLIKQHLLPNGLRPNGEVL